MIRISQVGMYLHQILGEYNTILVSQYATGTNSYDFRDPSSVPTLFNESNYLRNTMKQHTRIRDLSLQKC